MPLNCGFDKTATVEIPVYTRDMRWKVVQVGIGPRKYQIWKGRVYYCGNSPSPMVCDIFHGESNSSS